VGDIDAIHDDTQTKGNFMDVPGEAVADPFVTGRTDHWT
jgi:hypothetical protein